MGQSSNGAAPAAAGALVVVLSPSTARHLEALASAGWQRPVLLVGSVAEAREVLRGAAGERPAVGVARDQRPVEQGGQRTAPPSGARDPRALHLDADRRAVRHAGCSEELTPLEFGVLELLMARPGQVVRYAELTRTVWGTTFTGDSSHLHAVVGRLRRKLDGVQAPTRLVAVRGVGFRLAGLASETPTVAAV